MANTREKLDWQSLDIAAFKGPIKKAWDAYVKQRDPINEQIEALRAKLRPAQEDLENAVVRQLVAQGLMSQAQTAQFAYRFGGMAFAATEAKKAGKGKVTLG